MACGLLRPATLPDSMERASAGRILLFMRHGETDWNLEGRVMGRLAVALNENGREQCRRAGIVLANFGIDRVVSSPMHRALESARLVAAGIGVAVEEDEALAEVAFGEWEGKAYGEIMEDPRCSAFLSDPLNNRTPGGETIEDVAARGVAATGRTVEGETVLFVSHGDVIRSALCHYLAIPISEFRRVRVDNAAISVVRSVAGWSEVCFLNRLPDTGAAWSPVRWNSGV